MDREYMLGKITDKINNAYSDRWKSEATIDLNSYLDELLKDIASKSISAGELFTLFKASIKALVDNMEYGYTYYYPLLNRCIGLLDMVYELNHKYSDAIMTLLMDIYSEYNKYSPEYYRLVEKFITKDNAGEIINKAKSVKFGPDIKLVIIAYNVLQIPNIERIERLEKYLGRFGTTEYILKLYYKEGMDLKLKTYIENNMGQDNFKKQVHLANYYYHLLNNDKELALKSVRKACLFDSDLELFFDYVEHSSAEVEMRYYYDVKKYEFLLKILNFYRYYDAIMDVVNEANKFSLYKNYRKVLLPKYKDNYKKFLISYLDRKIPKLLSVASYERLKSVVAWVLEFDLNEDERTHILNSIYRSDSILRSTLNEEIIRLKN